MSWYNYINSIIVIISLLAIPYLIWIFLKVRKSDKELNQKRKELLELYSKDDKKEVIKND